MTRIDRLRELLDEPLLVTNLVNILYLTGFDSSNAALLVEPERARLFTDFRYITAARATAADGVEVVETQRSLMKWVGENLSARVGFEASILPYSFAEGLRGAGLDLVPREGLVEQLRAVKDAGELATIRECCAITDRMFERLVTEVKFVGRRERDVAWDISQLFHSEGAEGMSFESIVGSGATGSQPHARAGDKVIEARTSAATSPTTRGRSRRESSTGRCARRTTSSSPRSRRGSTPFAPASPASPWMPPPAR